MAKAVRRRLQTDRVIDDAFASMQRRAHEKGKTGINWPLRKAVITFGKRGARMASLEADLRRALPGARKGNNKELRAFRRALRQYHEERRAADSDAARLVALIRRPLTRRERARLAKEAREGDMDGVLKKGF